MRSARDVTHIHTVVVMVRGRLVDCLSFEVPEDAEEYKNLVRQWALDRRVLVKLWSQDARLLSPRANQSSRALSASPG